MTNRRQRKRECAVQETPLRTCIVTRAKLPPGELLRFVLSPSGEVVPDLAQALPGRGAWLVNARDTVETAVRKGTFNRAWRRKVNVPADLADRIEIQLQRRALDALSLANKAGCVITGYTSVDQRIEDAAGVILVQAADASKDGRQRLARKYQAICGALGAQPLIIDQFSVEQISLAIGRSNVVHAAVDREGVGAGLVRAHLRARDFCTGGSALATGTDRRQDPKSPLEQANAIGHETEQA